MPKFIKTPVEIEAYRWFQNGDHPEDEYIPGSGKEGKLVRRYRTWSPDSVNNRECHQCHHSFRDHGLIDLSENGIAVCPGDWVIKNENGLHSVMPDKDMSQKYTPINREIHLKAMPPETLPPETLSEVSLPGTIAVLDAVIKAIHQIMPLWERDDVRDDFDDQFIDLAEAQRISKSVYLKLLSEKHHKGHRGNKNEA